MPHSFTTPERTAVSGATSNHFLKLEIQDPDLNWVDVSSDFGARDWLNSVQISDAVDNNTLQFSAQVLRDTDGLSLAPFRSDSTLNRDSTTTYAQMLDMVRQWRVSVDVTTAGGTPTYKEIGKGYIDIIDVNDVSPTIDVTGRGEEAIIIDCEILDLRTYSVGDSQTMEEVIQALLDDNLGVYAPTLYVPVASDFVINEYQQDYGNLMQAIQAVAALTGGLVRYRYDSSGVNRLTLYFPNRDAVPGDEDWTIGATEYQRLPLNRSDISGVRNYVPVRYMDFDTGTVQTVESPIGGVSESITRYGRPFRSLPIDLAEDTQILTSEQAQALADAVCSDLQWPYLQQRFVTNGFWFVQLCDYGKLTANNVHYNSDTYGGVVNFTHTMSGGTIKTEVGLGGPPIGGYRKWVQIARRRRLRVPTEGPIGDPSLPFFTPPEGSETMNIVGTGRIAIAGLGVGTSAHMGPSGTGSVSGVCTPLVTGLAIDDDFEMGLCDVTTDSDVKAMSSQFTGTASRAAAAYVSGKKLSHVLGAEVVDDLTSANGARHLRLYDPPSHIDSPLTYPTDTRHNLTIPFPADLYPNFWCRIVLRNMYKSDSSGLVALRTQNSYAVADGEISVSEGIGFYRDSVTSKIKLVVTYDATPVGGNPARSGGQSGDDVTTVAVDDSDLVEGIFHFNLSNPQADTLGGGRDVTGYRLDWELYVRLNQGVTIYSVSGVCTVQQPTFNNDPGQGLVPFALTLHDPPIADSLTEVHAWEFVNNDDSTDPFNVIP